MVEVISVESQRGRYKIALDNGERYTLTRALYQERPVQPGEKGTNILFCKVEEEIENPFSMTVMLRCGADSTALLGWELDKEAWKALRGETVSVRLPEESLLLLEE